MGVLTICVCVAVNIFILGLANLFGGLFLIFHGVSNFNVLNTFLNSLPIFSIRGKLFEFEL